MKPRRNPKREALVARIEAVEVKAAKALSGLKAKFTGYTGFIDTLKRLKKDLRAMDSPVPITTSAAVMPGKDGFA